MKHVFAILLFTGMALFFTGCGSVQTENLLSEKQKYEIYQSVLKEVAYYKKMGDIFYQDGYLVDAVAAYEKVNFYEDKEVYSKAHIEKIRNTAKANALSYYTKAKNILKKDKFQALYFLNKMMRNDNTIQEGIALLNTLSSETDVKEFLDKKEKALIESLGKNDGTINATVSLSALAEDLSQYNDKSDVLIRAKQTIEHQYKSLLQATMQLYNKKQYAKATKDFNALQTISKQDKTIESYLNLIAFQEDIEKAKTLLANKNYQEAFDIAKKMQQKFPESKELKSIIEVSFNAQCSVMQGFLEDGIKLYNQQKLNNAKEHFQRILECEPSNKIAHTYMTKINQQLATLKKLR